MYTKGMISTLCFLTAYHCAPFQLSSDGGYGGGSGVGGGGGGASSYGHGGGDDHHDAKPYAFGYSVNDLKRGTNFNQHETSDGHNVKGQYTVALPDGRTQIVNYNADWKDGYHADVKYVGEAHHPEVSHGYGQDTGYGGGGASLGQAISSQFQNLAASHGGGGGVGGYPPSGGVAPSYGAPAADLGSSTYGSSHLIDI